MEASISLGETFFRDAVKAAAEDIPFGRLGVVIFEHVGIPFCKAAWAWLQQRKPDEQQQAIDEVAQIPFAQARSIAEAEVEALPISAEDKAQVCSYLSAIPMTTRCAISHPSDGGMPTTLLSHLPKRHDDFLKFVPLRPPCFQPDSDLPSHDYRLETLLGQGGFAEVWKASHIFRSEVPVALKFCLDPALIVSLETEIRVLDKLKDHEHPDDYVQLIDTAYRADPPFLIYEYVDGGDLVQWLASYDGQDPPVRDVVRILRTTARGLAFAHRQGVVHRDLKPSNILITRDGRVKIADFGIGAIMAQAQARAIPHQSIVDASILHGAYTPHYSDPGLRHDNTPDPRVDIYAFGVMAIKLLSGNIKDEMTLYWREDLEDKDIPAALLDIISQCVGRPSNRLSDAGVLASALDTLTLEVRNKSSWQKVIDTTPHTPIDIELPQKSINDDYSNEEEVEESPDTDSSPEYDDVQPIAQPLSPQVTLPDKPEPVAPLPSSFTNSIGMEFILIPAGSFTMGSLDSDQQTLDNEKPAHLVEISEPFYMGKNPVTQAQWQEVMGNNPSRFADRPNHPVEQVSWHEIQEFMQKLNNMENDRFYQLPTEAQWEYVCRAGIEMPRYHKDLDEIAWYTENSNRQTHPVGQKRSNAWQLHDMLGNVWEWVQDWYHNDYYQNSPKVDPQGPTSGTNRVIRGGGWNYSAQDARSAHRSWADPDSSSSLIGFRCLRTSERMLENIAILDSN